MQLRSLRTGGWRDGGGDTISVSTDLVLTGRDFPLDFLLLSHDQHMIISFLRTDSGGTKDVDDLMEKYLMREKKELPRLRAADLGWSGSAVTFSCELTALLCL